MNFNFCNTCLIYLKELTYGYYSQILADLSEIIKLSFLLLKEEWLLNIYLRSYAWDPSVCHVFLWLSQPVCSGSSRIWD